MSEAEIKVPRALSCLSDYREALGSRQIASVRSEKPRHENYFSFLFPPLADPHQRGPRAERRKKKGNEKHTNEEVFHVKKKNFGGSGPAVDIDTISISLGAFLAMCVVCGMKVNKLASSKARKFTFLFLIQASFGSESNPRVTQSRDSLLDAHLARDHRIGE
jgi:hypothetical protein